jgi:excisionase family DNA binding protein
VTAHSAPAVVVLGLAPDEHAHLVRALGAHARWCRENGGRLPPALAAVLDSLARSGQERPKLAPPPGGPEDVDVLLLDLPAVARRLSVSERTARRLAASGDLPSVLVGGCRRVRASDLANFVENI